MNTPSEILRKHEDANEMHFHEVDRKFIIEAMEEYAEQQVKATVKYYNGEPVEEYTKEKSEKPINLEISDEQIEAYVKSTGYYGHCTPEYHEGIEEGAKWYREQLKTNN